MNFNVANERDLITHSINTYIADHQHDENLVCHYMSQDYFTVQLDQTIQQAKHVLLAQADDNYIPSFLYVVDKHNFFIGVLALKSLIAATDEQIISDLVRPELSVVTPEQTSHDVLELVSQSDLESFAVIKQGRLVGVLSAQNIKELTEHENTIDAHLQGATTPLEDPYLATSPTVLWRKRVVWLLLLFVAEAYTGTVLKAFEEELEAAISLAFFIPLLIGTGGNSGTQITSTLVRAMALGEVSLRNLGSVLRKEISTGFLVAVTIAIAAWIRAWMLGVGYEVTLVVSLTIVAIVLWSAVVSSIIPMLLKRLRVDPAVVSAPFIATLIDGTGLIIYFEIAKNIMTDLV